MPKGQTTRQKPPQGNQGGGDGPASVDSRFGAEGRAAILEQTKSEDCLMEQVVERSKWKRPRTRGHELCALSLDAERAWSSAMNRRGPWWNAGASRMNHGPPAAYFTNLGLLSLLREQQRLQCAPHQVDGPRGSTQQSGGATACPAEPQARGGKRRGTKDIELVMVTPGGCTGNR